MFLIKIQLILTLVVKDHVITIIMTICQRKKKKKDKKQRKNNSYIQKYEVNDEFSLACSRLPLSSTGNTSDVYI